MTKRIIAAEQNDDEVQLDRSLHFIKGLGKRAGVALNPSTPAATLEEVLELLDLVLVMTVNPGFGGQSFIQYTLKKIRQIRRMLDRRNPGCELEVDGGIEPATAPLAAKAGAGVLVAGTAVFDCPGGPGAGVRNLLKACAGQSRK